jgi:hypothetical protein
MCILPEREAAMLYTNELEPLLNKRSDRNVQEPVPAGTLR